jgi:integrase
MARAIHRLSARQVNALTEPGRYADGGGLYLVVTKTGTKNWVFKFELEGRAREMGMGSASAISLAQAREKAADARKLLAEGRDPLEERRASETAQKAASVTFGAFADQYIRDQRSGWKNAKHRQQWENTIGDAYCATIRRRPIADVGTDDILEVLNPRWQDTPETARRLRMRLERILDAARARGLRQGENPARWRGHLDHLLPRQVTKKQHFAAMDFRQVPAFMAELKTRPAAAALAFRFLILTATRTSETLGARWGEIDLDARVWTIPASRMKAGKAHRVPLPDVALEVLEQAKGLHPELVFPGPRGGLLSNMAMLMLLRRMNRDDVTAHGFRSSFRDWAAEETSFAREVAEQALAHVIENAVEAAYRRSDLFEKRRKLMDAWAAFVTREPGKVIKMRPNA